MSIYNYISRHIQSTELHVTQIKLIHEFVKVFSSSYRRMQFFRSVCVQTKWEYISFPWLSTILGDVLNMRSCIQLKKKCSSACRPPTKWCDSEYFYSDASICSSIELLKQNQTFLKIFIDFLMKFKRKCTC